MPSGKGTYGSKVGRPAKASKHKQSKAFKKAAKTAKKK